MTKTTEETRSATTEWLTERLNELCNERPSLEMTRDASRTWITKDNKMMALYMDVYDCGIYCVYKDENDVCWKGVVANDTVLMTMSKLMNDMMQRARAKKDTEQ